MVTGGNGGLGKEAITQLALHHPAKIWMGARSEAKAKAAIQDINSKLPDRVDIEFLPMDLTSLKTVKTAAEIISSKSSRLDILMLNAGIMAGPTGKTTDGFEIQMGTNHFGHFYLTKQLLPLLSKTAKEHGDVRVVSMTSEAQNMAPSFETFMDKEKLNNAGQWARYGASKAANILFAAELARQHPELMSNSVHPGIVMTDLHNAGSSSWFGTLMRVFSPWIGSDVPTGTLGQLYACTRPKAELKNGMYYTPVGKENEVEWVKDKAKGRKFWEWTEAELRRTGF